MPTYDEAANIRQIIGRLRVAVPEAELLVADDSSPDGTGEIANELAAASGVDPVRTWAFWRPTVRELRFPVGGGRKRLASVGESRKEVTPCAGWRSRWAPSR
ncbi:glycosyltransferase [Fodinicola feengrottensis]|uniref:glycosyltransferase n=1 Tax=Fodinicola feengrottensis TaxID=435914 RepID=UPI0013D27663|nr:glycosyltransferase [Fodinicola feengrottensis]